MRIAPVLAWSTALGGLAAVALAQPPPGAPGGPPGGLREVAETAPHPVRNDVAQPGEEIVTLRYFRIQKGRFDDFLRASEEGVWPYFEKLGARVVGMWKVVHPVLDGQPRGEESPEYDEVYLMTRYASVEHWRATRDTSQHGGNGPDWEKCMEAIALRRSLTLETTITFLEGRSWANPPWFLPGLAERYRPAD
jgi:hypothetical protein